MTPQPTQVLPVLRYWTRWTTPRSSNRDEAFRENTIRITVGVLIITFAVSLTMQFTLYSANTTTIPLTILQMGSFCILLVAAYVIQRQKLVLSGQLLTATFLLITFSSAFFFGWDNNIVLPLLALTLVLATLVLPRNHLIPISALALLGLAATAYLQNYVSPLIAIPDPKQFTFITVAFILPLATIYLRQLRVEFDNRLADTQKSLTAANTANEQAENARREAERANKAKSQFLANMSHELRTPLNAVIGYTEIMLGGMVGTFTEKQTELQQHVINNGYRLRDLINDVLDLSRIEAGAITLTIAPLSPRKVVNELTNSLHSLAEKNQIGLDLTIAENTPEAVLGDRIKIEQIITNLLSNAIKFTTQGSVSVNLSVPDKDHWRLAIKDTGIGIPKDALGYIFEEFRQVDNSDTRRFQGTGLGLAITKRLIEKMGGTIEVQSELKVGSTFTVTLPNTITDKIA